MTDLWSIDMCWGWQAAVWAHILVCVPLSKCLLSEWVSWSHMVVRWFTVTVNHTARWPMGGNDTLRNVKHTHSFMATKILCANTEQDCGCPTLNKSLWSYYCDKMSHQAMESKQSQDMTPKAAVSNPCSINICCKAAELTSSWSSGTCFSPGLSPGLVPTGCRTLDSSRSPRRRRGPAASAPTCPYRTAASSRRAPTAGSQDGSAGGGCSGCYRAWRSAEGQDTNRGRVEIGRMLEELLQRQIQILFNL